MKFLLSFLILFWPFMLKAAEDTNDNEDKNDSQKTLKKGLLAFKTSQQVTPLISFGQNMLDKGDLQIMCAANEYKGDDQYFINVIPSFIYAFTDNTSLFVSAPIAVRYKTKEHGSSGFADFFIQFEDAFYTKAERTFYDQATFVVNVSFPTGSAHKNPNTGLGSNSFFLGGTFSRNSIKWLYFVSSGIQITTSKHQTKYGNQFLYQGGIARLIYNNKNWLFAWMLEIDGIYASKDKIKGEKNPNSGGNVIYMTPSIWISSSEHFIFQFGVGFPLQQYLFGNQIKNEYLMQGNVAWTF